MKNLLGTYLGFAAVSTLQHIIEDETNFSDKLLIRGTVYFLVQILWGDLAHESVHSISPNDILPAFKNLLLNETIASPFIVLEIAKSVTLFLAMFHANQHHEMVKDVA